jgi:predicted outer membrane repeat protein
LINTDVLTNTSPWGGGLYNHSDSVLNVTGGNIISNTAQTGSGGGVFNYSRSTIAISGTVLTKNVAQNYGGGISNMSISGTVAITNANVINNYAGWGAGISNGASGTRMAIDTSSISNNIAAGGSGGGIYNSSLLTITNSALANNVANPGAGPVNGLGGGLFTVFTTTITNTTISSNQAYTGGGIYADAFSAPNLTITFATIAYNQANLGGGMYLAGSPITNLRNTILALNQDANQMPDCTGSITSLGYNLIGNNNNCTFASLASDKVGTNASPIDPDMRGLGNYGGATLTHALNWTSPAIDQIPNGTNTCGTTITTDQRGRTRPHHGKCDIGAFEGWLELLNLPIIYK